MGEPASDVARLAPYVPRLVPRWLSESPQAIGRELDGSLVFVDVSGFTSMSDRLARSGRVGAEEVTQTVGSVFAVLLELAYADGGSLLKFGGDALLLLFEGPGHALRAARSAIGMMSALRALGPVATSAGRVRLRLSIGVHTARLSFFLVGDVHRELVVTGPAATETVRMEAIAGAGEIVVSPATARELPARASGAAKGEGILLRRGSLGSPPAAGEYPEIAAGVDLTPAIPLALRGHLLAGADDPEHRHAAIGFVRFEGVDDLIAGQGLDEAAVRIGAVVAAIQDAAARHGVTFLGTDVDRDGGKAILVAGAPRALGDEDERLLLTARAIVEADLPLAVRIGLNRGHVFAGDVGPPYRRTFTVMGDAVNVAARLMAKAERGSILATDEVLARSLTSFTLSAPELFEVKGKAAPIGARAVGPGRGSRVDHVHDLPLVGRERELAVLADALAGAREGHGRLVEVIGPPGIGKTRLLAELRELAPDFEVLLAHCELYASSTPYASLRGILRAALRIPASADGREAAARLRARVAADAPELAPWIPLLAVPLDVPVPATREVDELADEFRRAKLEECVLALLARVLVSPTLLAFEDVHWMDEASADLLRRLADEVGERPWAICATRREEEGGFVAPAAATVESLRPEPLGAEQATALLVAATQDAPLHAHETAALAERSGGNPLFLQELARAAREAGSAAGLPDSIEAMVAAQIDRLSPGDRRLLRQASVFGAAFTDELLASLGDGDEPDTSAWARLGDLVAEDAPGRRRFRHALIRDAAYEGLPYSRRRELHRRAAEALEARGGADAPDGLLAVHFFHAQRYEAAWRYARSAGDEARAKYASVDAADAYRRALEAARRAGGVAPEEIAEVLEALADATDRVGAYDEAARALRDARKRLAGDPVAVARLLRREAEIAERSGRYAQSLRLLGRGLACVEHADGADAGRERARLAIWYASGRMRQGRHQEAARWCARAIEEAERASDREALAWAYMVLDSVSVELGTPSSRPYGTLALAIYEELGDLSRQATIALNLGGRAYYEGRWEEALAYYERARDLYVRTGNTVTAADATFNIAELHSQRGRLEEAEPLLRDVVRVWRAAGDRVGVALAERELARVAYRAGRCAEALPQLERARSEFAAAGAEAEARETDLRIAECLVLGDDGAAALAVLYPALRRVRTKGELAGVRVPRVQRLRGWALARQGRPDEARSAFEDGIRAGRLDGADYEVALMLAGLAALEGPAASDGGEAHAAESREILARLGVVEAPAPLAGAGPPVA